MLEGLPRKCEDLSSTPGPPKQREFGVLIPHGRRAPERLWLWVTSIVSVHLGLPHLPYKLENIAGEFVEWTQQ
jgi:hypothetical protein